jgi:hypothetical protein
MAVNKPVIAKIDLNIQGVGFLHCKGKHKLRLTSDDDLQTCVVLVAALLTVEASQLRFVVHESTPVANSPKPDLLSLSTPALVKNMQRYFETGDEEDLMTKGFVVFVDALAPLQVHSPGTSEPIAATRFSDGSATCEPVQRKREKRIVYQKRDNKPIGKCCKSLSFMVTCNTFLKHNAIRYVCLSFLC